MKAILKMRIIKAEETIFNFYLMVKKQHQEAVIILLKGELTDLNQIIKAEKMINSEYDLFLKRSFYDLVQYSFFGSYLRKILGYSYIANELERIGDYVHDICQVLITFKLLPVQIKPLLSFWQKLLHQFEQVEKLFFSKDSDVLLQFLQTSAIKKLNFNSLMAELNNSVQDKGVSHFNQILHLYNQFKAIERSFAHLENIVEYLLLIRSFTEFWKYRKALSPLPK